MEQLKIITDLIKNPQKIYLSYDQDSDTWHLGVFFNGEPQPIPYGLGALLDNNSFDLDVRIEVLSCPATRLCLYLNSQLQDHSEIFDETGMEIRFDGVVVGAVGAAGTPYQGPAQLVAYPDPDTEDGVITFACYWLNSEGWVKVNDDTVTVRGELRLTQHFYYDIQE